MSQTKAEKLAAKIELAKLTFSLEILLKIKTNQATHGIKHGDYVRYQQYCTKRMHRIRQKLKFHHGARFKKKTITPEIISDERYLELVLLFSERAWAESMSLKEIDNDVNPRAKFHARRRLAKAAKWAAHLVSLCNAKATQRTVLEAESYHAWLWGNVLLEDEQWANALEFLVKAKTVYVELGKIGSQEQQQLCQERATEIEPTIRFCRFNLEQEVQGGLIDAESLVKMKNEADTNQSLDLLKSKLDTVLNDTRRREAKSMKEISWRSEKVPIKNEALRLLIVKANDLISELSGIKHIEKKRELYDRIQIQYNDALKLVQADMKKTKEKENDYRNLVLLEEYLVYTMIEQTAQRNQEMALELETTLAQSEKKESARIADEIVRMYELLIANLTDMKEKRDFDEQGTKSLAAQLLSAKAIRCFFVGVSYMKLDKFLEAMALFRRAEGQIIDALKHHDAVAVKDAKLIDKLESVRKQAIGNYTLSHALGLKAKMQQAADEKQVVSSVELEANEAKGTKLLINHQDEYIAFVSNKDSDGQERKLVQFPPHFEPISCKPLLLDCALDHVRFPDLSQRMVEQKKGFLSSWWG